MNWYDFFFDNVRISVPQSYNCCRYQTLVGTNSEKKKQKKYLQFPFIYSFLKSLNVFP